MKAEEIIKQLRNTVDNLTMEAEGSAIPHKIVYSLSATVDSKNRNFKKSRRSKRLHKKLLKRFNNYEFKQEAAIFKTPDCIIAHPKLQARIENEILRSSEQKAIGNYDSHLGILNFKGN